MLTLFDNMTLLKSSCVLCDKFVTHPVSICKDCYADLPRIKHACSLCAIPLNSNHNTEICGQCLSEKSEKSYREKLFRG